MAVDLTHCIQKIKDMDTATAVKINKMMNDYAANQGYSKGIDGDDILRDLAKDPNQLNALAKKMEIETLHDEKKARNLTQELKDLLLMQDKEAKLGITKSQEEHINATNFLTSLFELDKRQVRSGVNVESIKDDVTGIILNHIPHKLLEKFHRSFSDADSIDIAKALFKDKGATADAVKYMESARAGLKAAVKKTIGDSPEKSALFEKAIDDAFDNPQFDNKVAALRLTEDEYVQAMLKYVKGGNGIEAKLRAKYKHFYEEIHGSADYSLTEDMIEKHTLKISDFNNVNSYVKYQTEFNQLTSVAAVIQNEIITTGYKIGLYKMLGSNPQRTLNKIFSSIYDDPELSNLVRRSAGGSGTGVDESTPRGMLDITLGRDISPNAILKYSDATSYKEKASIGLRKGTAAAVRFNRSVLTKLKYTSDLGLSQLTQAMGDGQVIRFGRAVNNIPDNEAFTNHLRVLADMDGTTRKELLELATPVDYYLGRHTAISAREGDNVFASRNVDIATNTINTWNGYEKTGLAVFDAAALQANMDIAMNASKRWKDLTPEYKSFFLRNSWNEAKWNEMVDLDVVRKGKHANMVIDDSKMSVDLRDLYRATIINSAKFHSGRPTLHLRNLRYKLGGPIGTGRREIVDMFMYLQSFAITQAMNHVGNLVFNGGAGLKNINMKNMAFIIGAGVALHYLRFQITHALIHGEVLDIRNWNEDTKEGQTIRNGLITALSYGSGTGVLANWSIDANTYYGADVQRDWAGGLGTPQTQTAAYVNPATMFADDNLFNDAFSLLWGSDDTDEDKVARRRDWRGLSDFIGGYTPRSLYTSAAMRILADNELTKIKEEGIKDWQGAVISAIH